MSACARSHYATAFFAPVMRSPSPSVAPALRDGADVHAARRLRRQDHARPPGELARDDNLLLVAARERARRRGRLGGADVVVGEGARGVSAHGDAAEDLAVTPQDEVVLDREVE